MGNPAYPGEMTSAGPLAATEARAALALAADLASCRRPADLEGALFELPGLIGAEYVGAGELRRNGGDGAIGVLPQITQPYVFDADALADWAAHLHQHPVFARQSVRPDPRVLSYSDFVSSRDGASSASTRPTGASGCAASSRCTSPGTSDGPPFSPCTGSTAHSASANGRCSKPWRRTCGLPTCRLEQSQKAERWQEALESGLGQAGACVVMVGADGRDRPRGRGRRGGAATLVRLGAPEPPICLPSSPSGSRLSRTAPRAPRFVRVEAAVASRSCSASATGRAGLLVLQERRTARPDPAELADALPITRRQAEVLALLGEGCSDAEIAHRLGISVRTVGHHVEHILKRLEVSNRTAAAGVVSTLASLR